MKVQIFIRRVYGNGLIYPANCTAHIFARLIGSKTFSRAELSDIARLGYQVEQVADPAHDYAGELAAAQAEA